jgi:hypothetical protein
MAKPMGKDRARRILHQLKGLETGHLADPDVATALARRWRTTPTRAATLIRMAKAMLATEEDDAQTET